MVTFFKPFFLPHYSEVLKKNRKPYYLVEKEVFVDKTIVAGPLPQKIKNLAVASKNIHYGSKEFPQGEVNLLKEKYLILLEMLESCEFCERRCRVNRYEKEGVCGVGANPHIASIFLHYGEEDEIVPSLTIFYSGCNFKCLFCQNYDIARFPEEGIYLEPVEVAKVISGYEARGAKNVNFVGGEPTPSAHHIFGVLLNGSFHLPVIWNSNMFMTEELMSILIGCIDLYLADLKYGNDECARKLSGVFNYTKVVKRNLLTAWETADVIIRHLVLPGHLECCTEPAVRWLEEVNPEANLNVMFQYHPCADACFYGELSRRLTDNEKKAVYTLIKSSKLKHARVG